MCIEYAELNALALMYSCTIGQVHLLVANKMEDYAHLQKILFFDYIKH